MGTVNTESTTRIRVLSREVKLTYLQTLMVRGGSRSAGELAGEGGGVGSVSAATSTPGSPGFFGIGASPGSSYSMQSSDTGWVIQRTWNETEFDKARYAIGIRQIGAFYYKFEPQSELVSIEYGSPKPIAKVQLRVVEKIPLAFPVGGRYILYYVGYDGKTWHQINPLDHPTMVDANGVVVPKTLTFNSDVGGVAKESDKFIETPEPVHKVRLRAVFLSADIDGAEDHSPTLKSYRMLIRPHGGLR